MAGSTTAMSGGAGARRRGRLRFILISTLVLVGAGFYGGVTATKRALKGPVWAQRALGLETPSPVPAAIVPVAAPAAVAAPPAAAQTPPPPSSAPASQTDVSATDPNDGAHPNGAAVADGQAFLGRWEITDEIQAGDGLPAKIQSAYVFRVDGTGEFDTNGKKMYDFRWLTSGDFLTLTYDNEQAPQGADGAIRMRWSVTPDKTLLTLVPENGKDARATLYSVGPGVYHKK
jgi:hypothetical protein